MAETLTTVFMGPPGEAEVVRAVLECRGIPAFIPDDATRTIDPFMIGGLLMFDRAVQVSSSHVAQARACVEKRAADSQASEGEQELPPDFFEAESRVDPDLEQEVVLLSRRVQWCAILPIFSLFALWYLKPYMEAVERLGHKPPLHRITVAAALISPLYAASSVFAIVIIWPGPLPFWFA